MTHNEPLLARLDRFQQRALIIGGIGLLALVLGLFVSKEQFFRSYLFGYLFWLGLALGSFAIYMLHHMVGGAWGFLIRRILSATMRTLPLMALLFLPIVFGMNDLFPWARPEAANDHILHHKAPYLNVPFFLIRAVIYFAIWIGWSFLVFGRVRRLEETGDVTLIRKMQNMSAGGLLLLMLTVTFASIDWIMSLEPHWFSTIFGVIVIVGFALSTFCFASILLAFLSDYKPMSDVIKPKVFHDLGNLMFGFTNLWTYVSLSQFLIIYAGNLAEETPWYIHRLHGGWEWVGLAIVIFHFVVPFFILLNRRNKRNRAILSGIAAWLMLMQMVWLFWAIAPSFHQSGLHVHWLDLAAPLGIGGIFIWAFLWQLKQRPLLLMGDPRMQAALARVDEGEALVRIGEDLDPVETKGA